MARVVEPHANISAPDLLNLVPALFGWVRKEEASTGIRSMVKPLVDLGGWSWYYMILRTGCLYLFKKPDSSNFAEAIPLTSYRVLDAPDITKYQWVFKLVHLTEVKTLLFAVDTAFDLKKWKEAIMTDAETFCGREELDNYCEIDDSQTPERPLPPLPTSVGGARQRPPAPLPGPSGPLRPIPHPLSASDKLAPKTQQSLLPKQNNQPKKSATLARPPPLPREKRSPLPEGRKGIQRSASEASLSGKQGMGYDNVIQQFKGCRLSRVDEPDTELPKPPARPPGKNSGRAPPDGCEGQRGRQREADLKVTEKCTPFIPYAYYTDMTKEAATSALKSEPLGTYVTRPSMESESGRSLSVRDQNENGMPLVRHYRIFYRESLGYAIDTNGQRFESIPKTLEYYHQCGLPNTKQKLRYPYVPRL